MSYKLFTIQAVIAAATLQSCTQQIRSTPPFKETCTPLTPENANSLTLSPNPPCDLPIEILANRQTTATFMWNTFFALSWPAVENLRGIPNGKAPFGSDLFTPVWDTWKEKRELFRVVPETPTSDTLVFTSENPGSFLSYSNSADPEHIPPCSPEDAVDINSVRPLHPNKVSNYFAESEEIGLAVIWRNEPENTFPTEDTLVRFQVRFNQDYYNYVANTPNGLSGTSGNPNTGLYFKDGLTCAIGTNTSTECVNGGMTVNSPAGNNQNSESGSMMIKTAWVPLGVLDSPSSYYTTEGLYYFPRPGTQEEFCYKTGTFGLQGMHIIRKTERFPYFIFATFEHKNDTLAPYLTPPVGIAKPEFIYANTVIGTPPSSTLPNFYDVPYLNPSSPEVSLPSNGEFYGVTRLIESPSDLDRINANANALAAGTIWSNYRLVGVQYQPTDGSKSALELDAMNVPVVNNLGERTLSTNSNFPNFSEQNYYLANAFIETNQRFQFFTGGFTDTAAKNILCNHQGDLNSIQCTFADNTPILNNSSPEIVMGGCMGCHGRGAQIQAKTDFSFTLSTVLSTPGKGPGTLVETLEGACKLIGLSYNTTTGECFKE